MPALDTTASSVALGQLSTLPFKNIIGGPLNAAIEAQAQAAHTTVDFIQSVGFNKVNGELEAVYVEFLFEDSTGVSRRVQVPLLLIVPIPFIVIDTVDIQFKARISASAGQQSETREETALAASASGRFRFWGQRLDISASYSAKKDSKASQESKYSVEYTMDVHVHASQAGIPQGMAEVLNILQEGISNQPSRLAVTVFSLPALLEVASASTFSDDSFRVLVLDRRGEPAVGATVTVTPANGVIASSTADTGEDGLATLDLKPGALPDEGDAPETLQIEVLDAAGEKIVLSRQVTVRRPAVLPASGNPTGGNPTDGN